MSQHSEPTADTTIPVPWGHISAKWWGSKLIKPVICIHGWQDNAGTFDSLIPQLPLHLSFLCIDLPGHGRSSHLPEGLPYYLIWDGVILLRRILKYFDWNNIVIMGHSLGGIIGFFYAATFPNDVEGLISLDVVAPILYNNQIENLAAFIDKFLYYDELKNKKDIIGDYESMIDIAEAGHNRQLTRKSCECMMVRGMYKHPDGKFSFSRDNRVKIGWLAPVTEELVKKCALNVKCRYLNVKATPQNENTWPKYKEICDIIESSAKYFKLVCVEGTHHVHLNEPEKVASHITEFLDNCQMN